MGECYLRSGTRFYAIVQLCTDTKTKLSGLLILRMDATFLVNDEEKRRKIPKIPLGKSN